jgi:flagellar protein FlaG
MDVNSLLSQTINTLSTPAYQNTVHTGEIAIMEPVKKADESGGKEASREEIDHMLATLDRAAANVDQRVSFAYSEKTQRLIMRVTDPRTNEVVRQIPSKEVVQLLENIHDMIGVFIDEQR